MKEYRVGDIVRIRQWADMRAENKVKVRGLLFEGEYITFPNTGTIFSEEMKEFCGEKAEIIYRENNTNYYKVNFLNEDKNADMYCFVREMFEDETEGMVAIEYPTEIQFSDLI